jgi:transposase
MQASPNMSPIEHLWDELGKRIRHRHNSPETLQELRDAIMHEWNNIPQGFIQRLIGSFRKSSQTRKM